MTLILTAHDIYYYYLIGSRVIYIYKLSIYFLLSLIRNQFEVSKIRLIIFLMNKTISAFYPYNYIFCFIPSLSSDFDYYNKSKFIEV
jgi:hypothetical protein